MKVNEFIKEYESIQKNETMVKRLLSNIKSEDSYIPYLEKVTMADKIVGATTINKETNMFQTNTPARFILSTMELLYRCTQLEPSEGAEYMLFYSDYDMLNKYNLIKPILEYCEVTNEYKEFNTVLDMIFEDLYQNKYESHNFATEMIGMFAHKLTTALKPIAPILEKLANMDNNEINNMNEKLGKVIDKISK